MTDSTASIDEIMELARLGALHGALCDPRLRLAHLTGYMRALQEISATVESPSSGSSSEEVMQVVARFLRQALDEGSSELKLVNAEIEAAVTQLGLEERAT